MVNTLHAVYPPWCTVCHVNSAAMVWTLILKWEKSFLTYVKLDKVPRQSSLCVIPCQKCVPPCQKQHGDKNYSLRCKKFANDFNVWDHLSGFFMLSSVILKDLESTLIGMSAWGLMNLIIKVLFQWELKQKWPSYSLNDINPWTN